MVLGFVVLMFLLGIVDGVGFCEWGGLDVGFYLSVKFEDLFFLGINFCRFI